MGRKNKLTGKQTSVPTNTEQLLQQAQYYQQSGFLGNAEVLYKSILQSSPKHPDALHYLGLLYHQQGRSDQALSYIEKSIQINHQDPVYYNNYGLVQAACDQLEEAARAHRQAVELDAGYAEGWFNLGVVYTRLKKPEAAEEAYRRAVMIRPDYIKALFNLSSILDLQSKRDEAREIIEKLLAIVPESPEVHNAMGLALFKLGGNENLKKADEHFWKALTLKPDYLEVYMNLGMLRDEGNQPENAIKCYSKALELAPEHEKITTRLAYSLIHDNQIARAEDCLSRLFKVNPDNHEAQLGAGMIRSIQGEFAEAEKIFNKILDHDAGNASALFGLAYCKKYAPEDVFIKRLEQSVANHPKSAELHFALGKVCDDIGLYDEAFAAYHHANSIKNEKVIYDAEENSKFIDKIVRVFTRELLGKLQSSGRDSQLPVFITGTPRSGTTLTEQIISSHPDVYGAGELAIIPRQITRTMKPAVAHMGYPECLREITPAQLMSYADDYLRQMMTMCAGGEVKRVTDKMPENYFYIGYIACLFPQAKIIHCKRNPLDACLSIYFQPFLAGHQYKFDLVNLGRWYLDYLRLMEHWSNLLGDRIMHVDYDDTVNNLEATARRLIDYCGLEWNEKCLEFHKTSRNVRTASQWQVRQPIYKTSLNRWKRYDKHIGVLKEILAGYY